MLCAAYPRVLYTHQRGRCFAVSNCVFSLTKGTLFCRDESIKLMTSVETMFNFFMMICAKGYLFLVQKIQQLGNYAP